MTKQNHENEAALGKYQTVIISLPEECDDVRVLPLELRYLFSKDESYKPRLKQMLISGKSIGVATLTKAPENILEAVHTIATISQENYILSWLPKLLAEKHFPHITDEEKKHASEAGHDIDAAVQLLANSHPSFKHLTVNNGTSTSVSFEEEQLIKEMNELLYPLQVEYAVHRIVADNANERTEIAQSIVKALLFIGPIAHILEKFAAGIGKVFAAFSDDLLGEAAELTALRGSGFSWSELLKRSRILIPILILATFGAYSVEGLLESGHLIIGGVVYGFSAVALSLTTAIQSFFLYHQRALKLVAEGKLTINEPSDAWRLALRQDFTNPARLGLFVGAACAPIMGILGSVTGLMHNGWVLAAIGSTESIVAGLTVIFAERINNWQFHKKLRRTLNIS